MDKIFFPEYLTEEENLRENERLSEMGATLRKARSGLPVNMFLDDCSLYKLSGHWKRVKFQPNKGNLADTRSMIPMSISDNPEILVKNPKLRITNKELDQIKAFVRMNKQLLLDMADQKIDFGDFLDKMKTV